MGLGIELEQGEKGQTMHEQASTLPLYFLCTWLVVGTKLSHVEDQHRSACTWTNDETYITGTHTYFHGIVDTATMR